MRNLTILRQEIRTLWEERESRMWSGLISKVNTKEDSKGFWKEINKMRGLRGAGCLMPMRDEQGWELRGEEEEAEAFKARMKRTFNISEQENENYSEDTEEMVRMWHLVYRDQLIPGDIVHIREEDRITTRTLKIAIKSFKEKAPGISGITRNYLVRAPDNIIE